MLHAARSLLPHGRSFTATVIIAFTVATTMLSLYDLHLFLKLVTR